MIVQEAYKILRREGFPKVREAKRERIPQTNFQAKGGPGRSMPWRDEKGDGWLAEPIPVRMKGAPRGWGKRGRGWDLFRRGCGRIGMRVGWGGTGASPSVPAGAMGFRGEHQRIPVGLPDRNGGWSGMRGRSRRTTRGKWEGWRCDGKSGTMGRGFARRDSGAMKGGRVWRCGGDGEAAGGRGDAAGGSDGEGESVGKGVRVGKRAAGPAVRIILMAKGTKSRSSRAMRGGGCGRSGFWDDSPKMGCGRGGRRRVQTSVVRPTFK